MLVLRITDPAPIERVRWLVFDTYQHLKPRIYDPRSPVKLIDIDDDIVGSPWTVALAAHLIGRHGQSLARELGSLRPTLPPWKLTSSP